AQLQWTCNADYMEALTRYFRETEEVTHPHIKQVRTRVWRRLWKRMFKRQLRREHLVLFISIQITGLPGKPLSANGLGLYYEKILDQLRGQFEEITGTLRTIFGADATVTPMDDLAHFTYCTKFLNPSLAERFDVDFAGQFN